MFWAKGDDGAVLETGALAEDRSAWTHQLGTAQREWASLPAETTVANTANSSNRKGMRAMVIRVLDVPLIR